MRFAITEICEYLVDADDAEQAEELFLHHGPALSADGPVQFVGATSREIEPAIDLNRQEASST